MFQCSVDESYTYVGLGAVGVEDEFVDCESVAAVGVVVVAGAGVVGVVVSVGEDVVDAVSVAGASSAYAASGTPPSITTDIPISSND